jgi:thiosulfate reductase cytochrome b subunit
MSGVDPALNPRSSRHSAVVRVTHWLTFFAFTALLISGCEIVISHPRFYWGETGNVMTRPLFTLHIPSSRETVPTGYGFVMPDENGWSRALHFQAAWLLAFTALVYGIASVLNGHFRKDLMPDRADRAGLAFLWRAFRDVFTRYLHRAAPQQDDAYTYNAVQRAAYLLVIFVLFPLIIWTGLAMSPAFTGALPITVIALGGRQTARTLHFFLTWSLVLFLVVHVTMITLSGFRSRMRAMITGRIAPEQERP